MATKPRIGLRCYNPYVPNDVWDIFKKDLRKLFKEAFPDHDFQITEFYWQGFPTSAEYIRIRPKDDRPVDWKRVWSVLDFTARSFGMKINYVYQEDPGFRCLSEDTLFERKYSSYSLKNIRTWTDEELDAFLKSHSFDKLREQYHEAAI